MNIITISILSLAIIGAVAALILYIIAQRFKVEEDPRIDEVEKTLPGANCGGCGKAGCRNFAESCVKATPLEGMLCPVGGNKDCLGCGDCVSVCSLGAISINPETHLPEVDIDICGGCGACSRACPRNIIEVRKKGAKGRSVYVSCVNKDKGGVARKACEVACIGCGKCAKECKFDAITIANNLSYIDSDKCKMCRKCVDVCPTGAILAVNFPPKKVVETHSPQSTEQPLQVDNN